MEWPRVCAAVVFVCVLALLPLMAQTAPAATSPPPNPPTASQDDDRARIGAGDLLDISVYGAPDLSQRVRVSKSGEVYLPLVNYVPVGGMTVEDAQAEVEKRLVSGGFMKNPHVTIVISEAATGIALLGEVERPGIYPAHGTRRLLDLFSAAGGLTKEAGRIVTITRRDKPQEPETIVMPNDPALVMKNNVEVRQGDTVMVSKAGIVYVVGEVEQPSGFVMEQGQTLTVLKAIAMAHGTTRMAATKSVRIIRRSPTGLQEVPVPLAEILQAKKLDVPLEADDILFVPSSKTKNAAARTLETIVQIGTGVSIRRF